MHVIEIDGKEADAGTLGSLAFAGYGHFTFMQVRDGKVRGLDLHLDRLRQASVELFGVSVDNERVRRFLRQAVRRAAADCSAQVVIYPVDNDAVVRGKAAALRVLVRIDPPWIITPSPIRLRTTMHERFLPHVKSAATMDLTYHTRAARLDGYDDVLFTDRHGRISEASIWNIAFHDGTDVVWPAAPALAGIAMQVAKRGLERLGISQRTTAIRVADCGTFRAAALMNSLTPGLPVATIDAVTYRDQDRLPEVLRRAHESEPMQPV